MITCDQIDVRAFELSPVDVDSAPAVALLESVSRLAAGAATDAPGIPARRDGDGVGNKIAASVPSSRCV